MNETSKAKQVIIKDNLEEDLVAKGFHKLDSNLIETKPPKISWGGLYKGFTDKEKIEYLEKLASTMNHAAYLIQEERNGLLKLMDKKEEQLIKMQEAMEKNDEMVQTEVTKMNGERQKFNESYAKLKREVENGNND